MSVRHAAIVLAVLAGGGAAGCGGEALSDADERAVAEAVGAISFYCPTPDAPEKPAPPSIVSHVEKLIAIHDENPNALYLEGHEEEKSMTRVMELADRSLRWCDPSIADRVKSEL